MTNQPSTKTAPSAQQRALIYCQHILGMGHLIRSLAIARALEKFDVVFVNGGEALSDLTIPAWVTVVNLPPMTSDAEFRALKSTREGVSVEHIQRARKHILLELMSKIRPDVVIIELFPFGRKRFAFELLPLLAHIRLSAPSTKVVCSLRDILVTKPDQSRHENWVVSLMNRYFDLLLVHSDPTFQTLDETFSRCHDLLCPIQHTGFVTQNPPLPAQCDSTEEPGANEDTPLILASIGGGRVGYELLDSTVRASLLLASLHPHRMLLFTGPYMPDSQYEQLRRLGNHGAHIEIRRFTTAFEPLMRRAALSVSMAGYNTCMNLLNAGTRALVLPFTGNKNDEQTIRARKLEERGLLTVLSPADLHPERLALKMAASLAAPLAARHTLNTDGGKQTALAVERLAAQTPLKPPPSERGPISLSGRQPEGCLTELRRFLEVTQDEGQDLHLFLRDDDVDEDEEPLRHLLDIALARGVPMNMEIIPGRLTEGAIAALKNTLRADPALLSLNQHGWMHMNHEQYGRTCEFGPSRSLVQQADDITRGKAVLESAFEDRFYPAFTPPWNRCTAGTLQILDELGFLVFSKDRGKQPIPECGLTEISTTLDLFSWKTGPRMKPPHEIVHALIGQLTERSIVGLLLHHKVMERDAFRFLDQLLCELSRHSRVRFHTFPSLVAFAPESQAVPR